MGKFETYIMPGEAGMSVFDLPEPFVRLEGPTFVRVGRVADVAETVYGRREQLVGLERMLNRQRWFFAKVSGRRRIGKTTLIQKAMQEIGSKQPPFYVQVPDSEPAGVLLAVNDALETFQVPLDRYPRPNNLLQFAKLLETMAEGGYILVLDEFQYFNRKGYEEFCSFLQAGVDRLAAKSEQVRGGLIVLGRSTPR